MKSVCEIAREFMCRGGKKLRPRLCRIVYDALVQGGAGGGDFGKVLEAVECFHKASLIHDDIQDGDEVRYGRPSVHAEHGIPFAIAVGDYLVASGYYLISTSGFPRVADMLSAASCSHLALSEGQGDDLAMRIAGPGAVSADTVLSVYIRKTGEAFALAAELGAIAALGEGGARSNEIEKALHRFGITFGVVFQMRDDMADGECALDRRYLETARAQCVAAASATGMPELERGLLEFMDETFGGEQG